MKRIAKTLCCSAFAFQLMTQILLGCPTCKGGLHDGTALGYAISIVFMMAMPFAILAFWVITILRLRAKMLQESASTR